VAGLVSPQQRIFLFIDSEAL